MSGYTTVQSFPEVHPRGDCTTAYLAWYIGHMGKKQESSKKWRGRRSSSFDSFLEDEGIRGEVDAVAVKRVLAWQLKEAMREQKRTKQSRAKQLRTSRS
jgi:hypothetical protein